jgi:hypothetical protein
MAVLAVHHDEHALLRFVDGDDDLGGGGAARQRRDNKKRSREHGCHSILSHQSSPAIEQCITAAGSPHTSGFVKRLR